MTDYADGLIAATSSWSAAYLEFITGREREDFEGYAFVEDDDDKLFYQHVLSNYDSLSYLGCGGKSGVLSVYEKLAEDNLARGQLFFVDRDTDEEPLRFSPQVHRTAWYSWESHLSSPDLSAWIIRRRLSPSPTLAQIESIRSGWSNTIHNFRFLLAKHTALLNAANKLNTSLQIHKIVIVKNALPLDNGLIPNPDNDDWYQNKISLAVAAGASSQEIEEQCSKFENSDQLATASGKVLFSILRRFVPQIAASLSATVLGEFNSARAVCSLSPWDYHEFDYIRNYASWRLSEV